MTSLDQRRRQRALNGSRRKRDLEAVEANRPDWVAFIAEHFPDEHHGYAYCAVMKRYLAKPKRDRVVPTADEVREEMRSRGWLREQREESTCQ